MNLLELVKGHSLTSWSYGPGTFSLGPRPQGPPAISVPAEAPASQLSSPTGTVQHLASTLSSPPDYSSITLLSLLSAYPSLKIISFVHLFARSCLYLFFL